MEEGSKLLPYDPSQEPIFPSELQVCGFIWMTTIFMDSDILTKVPELFVNFPAQLNDGLDKTRLIFSSDRVTWYRPTSLDDLLTLKSTNPEAELVIGNTKAGTQIPLLSLHEYQ